MGVTEQYDLPVTSNAVHEFADAWSKFDPNATGFINIKHLDGLLIALANSKHAQELLILVDYVRDSEYYRHKLISVLEIPTFFKFKKVMFYDVL